jgi:hypothetical protein
MHTTILAPRSLAAHTDRVVARERQINALIAEQYDDVYALSVAHVEASISASADIDPDKLGRSIVAQIGLACGKSPTKARERIHLARDLAAGHDHVRGLFAAGELDEAQVRAIGKATANLDPVDRATVDRELASHPIQRMGVKRLGNLARKIAAEVDPEGFLARATAARSARRVTIRPGRDGMAYFTGCLPVEQAVACYAALLKAYKTASASPEPLTRTEGQYMADTLVERITGQKKAEDVNVEIQVLVKAEDLVDRASPLPVEVPGHGPIPAAFLSAEGRMTWRRIVTQDGIVIGGDSRSRTFTGVLADLIKLRDGGRCTEPFCDAPIRHIDHIQRWSEGGKTEFDNGRGLCAFHNRVRELGDWRALRRGNTTFTTTPTGHTYTSTPERHTSVRRHPTTNAVVPLAFTNHGPWRVTRIEFDRAAEPAPATNDGRRVKAGSRPIRSPRCQPSK